MTAITAFLQIIIAQVKVSFTLSVRVQREKSTS